MFILAIDTTSNLLTVALYKDNTVLTTHSVYMERGQGEALMPLLQKMFAEVGCSFKELDMVVSAVGPGSFTGVRIGLSVARGLGLALNIPVKGVSNFDAIALSVPKPCVVALDTKRGDFYAQIYDENNITEACVLSQQAVEELHLPIVTDKPELFDTDKVTLYPMPEIMAVQLIQTVLTYPERLFPAEPLYLREADVTVQKKCN